MGGIVVATDTFFFVESRRLADLSNRYQLLTVGPLRDFAVAGGLISYGADVGDVIRRAAVYVGRILRGAKPSSLPVQQPTRFELLVNLKTAKMLGITMPPTLLARADEVIE